MSTTTTNAAVPKTTLASACAEISDKYPTIYTCHGEKKLLAGDFKLIVQTLVSEKAGPGSHEFEQIKRSRFHEILNRACTKRFDEKAKMTGEKSFLELACDEAARRKIDEVNQEAFAELAAINPLAEQLAGVMQQRARQKGCAPQ